MKESDDKKILRALTEFCGLLIGLLLGFLLMLLLSGCKTVERESVVIKTDTLHHYTQSRDSVVYRDSVFVHLYERGDTVYHVTERWNVRYNDRVRTDTVYRVREVAQQSKEAEEKKEMPWVVRVLVTLFYVFILLIIGCIIREIFLL